MSWHQMPQSAHKYPASFFFFLAVSAEMDNTFSSLCHAIITEACGWLLGNASQTCYTETRVMCKKKMYARKKVTKKLLPC